MRQAFTSSYFVINCSTVAQGLWGTETACQVVLSGVYDLDKWRGAGMLKSDLGKPTLYP
jgi:putative transposase